MSTKNYNITADSLIIEYMITKIKNGASPNFTISEFMDFLNFFEKRMKVEDTIKDGKALMERFLERECEKNWNQLDDITGEKLYTPHLDFNGELERMDANYRFRCADTCFVESRENDKEVKKVRQIIEEYVNRLPKREIAISESLSENDLLMGNLICAHMILFIWSDYVAEYTWRKNWPQQCRDIYKYLFDVDLASIIEVPSIKEKTIEFYNIVSRRIASLYQNDKKLQLSNCSRILLPYSNYLCIMQDYKDYAYTFFDYNKRNIDVNLRTGQFTESHNHRGVNFTTEFPIDGKDAKKLVYKLNELQK